MNAPEMNSQVAYRERLARSARAKAKKFCPEGAVITIQTAKEHRDRYARYLAEVVYKNQNLSDYLLKIGAAKLWE
ncbi:MAG: thermonuclease family protein [Cyclobacteriaceae bacterium]